MCVKKLWKYQKNDFGVFIEHKNNFEHEGRRFLECDTCDQCSYEVECSFDDAMLYNKVCLR
ncbi:hypothetical protein MCU_00080 [Bartonella elizabethae Re6043vi]|uniref:Uncharacterized protein n=2 Tax=Bartonella elizabethae TaxID=807 RepID=J1A0W5_BAREL|nr:hypothetical protein [Bartonella elizabethae]EJF84502.1 hypothetical protein MCU_00080 [Bartonella elizabethae Re6043vi]EJF95168.1 hypothetical protein MEE_01210 [Bartonella elizabethae F9251 = ATCC 49927]VEJ41614.1 Uncharacterised protein [Bartonella elizabethae]